MLIINMYDAPQGSLSPTFSNSITYPFTKVVKHVCAWIGIRANKI